MVVVVCEAHQIDAILFARYILVMAETRNRSEEWVLGTPSPLSEQETVGGGGGRRG